MTMLYWSIFTFTVFFFKFDFLFISVTPGSVKQWKTFSGHPDFHRADAHSLQHPSHLPWHPGGLPGGGAGVLRQGVRLVHPLPLDHVPWVGGPPPRHAQRLLQLPHLLLRVLSVQSCSHKGDNIKSWFLNSFVRFVFSSAQGGLLSLPHLRAKRPGWPRLVAEF